MQEMLINTPQKLHKKESEFISVAKLSLEELKNFYILCGRLPIQQKINFDRTDLQPLVNELQDLLEDLLVHQYFYQPELLRILKVPEASIETYLSIKREEAPQDFDEVLCRQLPEDRNATYCSIQLFRHLWVSSHYVLYIKAKIMCSQTVTYPIKRYTVWLY